MHSNEMLLRRAYEAMARGDGHALAELLTERTRWVICGRGPLGGMYTGPGEIFALWKRIAAQTGGGLDLEVRDVLANDRRAVVLVTVRGERGRHRLEERQIGVFDIEDDKVIEATFVYEDPDAYDEFWSE